MREMEEKPDVHTKYSIDRFSLETPLCVYDLRNNLIEMRHEGRKQIWTTPTGPFLPKPNKLFATSFDFPDQRVDIPCRRFGL